MKKDALLKEFNEFELVAEQMKVITGGQLLKATGKTDGDGFTTISFACYDIEGGVACSTGYTTTKQYRNGVGEDLILINSFYNL